MKRTVFLLLACIATIHLSVAQNATPRGYDTIRIVSHLKGLQLALLHEGPGVKTGKLPVLFIHGSSFPSALAAGYRFNGVSWMDYLVANQYDCYALDFLGYGNSDRYPEMSNKNIDGHPPGQAVEVYQDIDKAINFIIKKTGSTRVNVIAHSWGGSVAALYASKFPEKVANLVLFAALTAGSATDLPEKINYSYEGLTPDARVQAMVKLTPAQFSCQLEASIYDDWKKRWLSSDPSAGADGEVHFPSGPSQDIDDLEHGRSYYNPADIRVPTLLIRGEWDKTPSNADFGTLFSQLTNAPLKKYVVIEKGTHVLHLEKNRIYLYPEVLNFLNNNSMPAQNHSIAVIFEVIPADGEKQEYLDIAASLKPELEKIDGFVSIERFQSLTHPEKILSLSFWRDEQAIQQWRNLEVHRTAQSKGRTYIFKDYHLRIADVVRDYGMFDRVEAPADSRTFHR